MLIMCVSGNKYLQTTLCCLLEKANMELKSTQSSHLILTFIVTKMLTRMEGKHKCSQYQLNRVLGECSPYKVNYERSSNILLAPHMNRAWI